MKDRQVFIQQRSLILCKVADLNIMSQCECSFVLYLLHDTFHQRRLTLTVLSHKSHFITALDSERRIAEHYVVAIRLAYPVHNNRIIATSG